MNHTKVGTQISVIRKNLASSLRAYLFKGCSLCLSSPLSEFRKLEFWPENCFGWLAWFGSDVDTFAPRCATQQHRTERVGLRRGNRGSALAGLTPSERAKWDDNEADEERQRTQAVEDSNFDDNRLLYADKELLTTAICDRLQLLDLFLANESEALRGCRSTRGQASLRSMWASQGLYHGLFGRRLVHRLFGSRLHEGMLGNLLSARRACGVRCYVSHCKLVSYA